MLQSSISILLSVFVWTDDFVQNQSFKIREALPYSFNSSIQKNFTKSNFSQQNLLCELYLHEKTCFMDVSSNPIPHMGDIHLRDFASFVTNRMKWGSFIQTIQRNEDTCTLWVQSEPQYPTSLRARHMRNLTSPHRVGQMEDF